MCLPSNQADYVSSSRLEIPANHSMYEAKEYVEWIPPHMAVKSADIFGSWNKHDKGKCQRNKSFVQTEAGVGAVMLFVLSSICCDG